MLGEGVLTLLLLLGRSGDWLLELLLMRRLLVI